MFFIEYLQDFKRSKKDVKINRKVLSNPFLMSQFVGIDVNIELKDLISLDENLLDYINVFDMRNYNPSDDSLDGIEYLKKIETIKFGIVPSIDLSIFIEMEHLHKVEFESCTMEQFLTFMYIKGLKHYMIDWEKVPRFINRDENHTNTAYDVFLKKYLMKFGKREKQYAQDIVTSPSKESVISAIKYTPRLLHFAKSFAIDLQVDEEWFDAVLLKEISSPKVKKDYLEKYLKYYGSEAEDNIINFGSKKSKSYLMNEHLKVLK